MTDRLEAIAIARILTNRGRMEVARDIGRFAPPTVVDATWRTVVEDAVMRVRDVATRDELVHRIGKHAAKTWADYTDRVFPCLALGASPDTRIAGRDAWAAAIAARALGLWTHGGPPSLAAVCDAFAWQKLGLAGKPKRCPPEVRAVFFVRELATEPGPPDRMVRLYAAKQVGAARPELRALRDALVRRWLAGTALEPRALIDEVRDAARSATSGVFGDRKVFISSVWDELRRHPTWSSLTLEELKARLVRAHRDGQIVLARADLVAAMPADLVAASETKTDGASFHFIVREEA